MRDKKKGHFLQNGGLLLEKLISSFHGKSNPIRSFSEKELIKATANYSASSIFSRRSQCIWYKGSLEGRLILVKKFRKEFHDRMLEFAIKDIATGAQMGVHKNALKLLGCCLETYLPTPVYEFPINGLFKGLRSFENLPNTHNPTWKNRLSIAVEIANVVSYLHLAFPRPIIHRNLKLGNFLLDQDCVPKICTFILSVPLPEGETHVVADEVAGSIGSIAPEHLTTRTVTEKIDVFSFGVLLLELLTGKMAIDLGNWNLDKDVLLVDYVREHLNHHGDFSELVDPNILAEQRIGIHERQQMKKVLGLALYCTLASAEERPTMMEVGKQLKQIQRGKFTQPEANPGASISLDKSLPKSKVSLSLDDDGLIQHLSRQPRVILSYGAALSKFIHRPKSLD